MAKTKYHIKKHHNNAVYVLDDEGNVVYTSTRHSLVQPDSHPYLSGFLKIADMGSSYDRLLKRVHKSPTKSIQDYWDNIGSYTMNVIADHNNG